MNKITPEQIIDDWFHEYCEGRCEKEEMVEILERFAHQRAKEYYNKRLLFENEGQHINTEFMG